MTKTLSHRTIKLKDTNKNKNNKKSKKIHKKNKTQKHNISKLEKFKQKFVLIFFEILLQIKLYHWNTFKYSVHVATDELYNSLNENMDKFVEVLLGEHSPNRISMVNQTLQINSLNTLSMLEKKIDNFKKYMSHLEKHHGSIITQDLLSIRDEIIVGLNKFKYLLSFM